MHLSEACAGDAVHLITHAMTTEAAVHEARCTAAIHRALAGNDLHRPSTWGTPPTSRPGCWCAAARIWASVLVGPSRPDASWQAKLAGGYGVERFEVDWERERVRCPQGKLSSAWSPSVERTGRSYIRVLFRKTDCGACPAQASCTRAKHRARYLKLRPRAEHEPLKAACERLVARFQAIPRATARTSRFAALA